MGATSGHLTALLVRRLSKRMLVFAAPPFGQFNSPPVPGYRGSADRHTACAVCCAATTIRVREEPHDASRLRQGRRPHHRRKCPRPPDGPREHREPDRQARSASRTISSSACASPAWTPTCRWSTKAGRTRSAICADAATGSISCSPAIWTRPIPATRSISPGDGFKPKAIYRDGWVWGLGANNMKSGLASALIAIEAIAKAGIKLAGDISFGGVVGEIEKTAIEEFQGVEYSGYGIGTRHLVTHGVTADFALLAEPTGMRIAVANHGLHLAAHHGRRHGCAFGARQPAERGQRHRGHARAADRHRPMGARLRGCACLHGRASQCDDRGHPRRRAVAAVAQSACLQPLSRYPHRARPDRRRRQARPAAGAARASPSAPARPSLPCMSMSAIRRPCWTKPCRSSRRSARRRRR